MIGGSRPLTHWLAMPLMSSVLFWLFEVLNGWWNIFTGTTFRWHWQLGRIGPTLISRRLDTGSCSLCFITQSAVPTTRMWNVENLIQIVSLSLHSASKVLRHPRRFADGIISLELYHLTSSDVPRGSQGHGTQTCDNFFECYKFMVDEMEPGVPPFFPKLKILVCHCSPATHTVVLHLWHSVFGRWMFHVAGAMAWNVLPDSLKDPTLYFDSFCRDVKTLLLLI